MHLKQEFWKVWLVDCCILVARGYVVPGSCGGDFVECKQFTLNLCTGDGAWAASL